ncbi:MAG: DUF362 domain-containing protein [Methanocalculus sp. MSAO_Arc1]|uniref:DUF362 domain-containing protein n=1 Tax=Methanocalculus TaxID=71151 RepID=UPI000FF7A20B|nr:MULTISPECIES: DUF362 domain-containing protein [unclassified Methanocalculus]MCP1661685.1 putative Fe-S center protein [Methanocalculus sp. AMF5]RQD81438.1 MAG: DUF362 domain-containing protein [Methanocalculus sp. MSAO_Arc1]
MAAKAAKVWFASSEAGAKGESLQAKLLRLLDETGLCERVAGDGGLVAVKTHFGEEGCDSFVSPLYIRQVVGKVKEAGGVPFLTDTNTLYRGMRHNAVSHLALAIRHGFGSEVTGAPVFIADGLRSENEVVITIPGVHLQEARIATGIAEADSLVVVSHVKGHAVAGFGGAIKNLAMGCASAAGKHEQHRAMPAIAKEDGCEGCGGCVSACPENAIIFEGAARIDPDTCIGCGICVDICPESAIYFDYERDAAHLSERLAEYALAAASLFPEKVLYLNFLLKITPDCDCAPFSDRQIVPDIGILASADPVAIDAASLDIINAQHGLDGTRLLLHHAPGEDKFAGVWPQVPIRRQVIHGEQIGLGSSEYELIRI